MNPTITPRVEAFSAYARARHNIYLKRAAGWPGPWTDDPILRDGRFCNIFRELDTVTQWIEKHIRQPYADHPHLWFMLAIARYINWPPTLAYLIELAEVHNVPAWPSHPLFECGEAALPRDGFEASTLTWALQNRSQETDKTYTGAYMIRAESDPSKHWYTWTKHRYIAEIVLGRLWEDRAQWVELLEASDPQPSLQQVWDHFQQHRYIGWGPFMAYEVVTDLRHTRYLRQAPDILTWANAGPGAIRGLNRLYGRELKEQPKRERTNNEMFWLLSDMNGSAALWPSKWPRFEMRDIEHTLCEFDKYERVRLGEGKMRSKYDWRKATQLEIVNRG